MQSPARIERNELRYSLRGNGRVSLVGSMLPYALGAMAAAPIVLVVSAVIVTKAKRPIAAGLAFVVGAVALDVVFAIIILAIAEATGVDSSSGDLAASVDTILGAVFVILGVAAVFSKPSPEKEEAQRHRVEGFALAGFGSLFKLGVAVQVINSDALVVYAAGLKEIPLAEPAPGVAAAVIAVIIFLVIMLVPYHLPIDLRAIAPQRSRSILGGMTEWLLARTRLIEIVVGLGLGGIFLFKGLSVLL
ncbi:MAG TPA: GAP family protein [Acidimicrobiia bacterium]|nr:GAP family protein [Acidimicrobiia bacterium]